MTVPIYDTENIHIIELRETERKIIFHINGCYPVSE